ncbi:MAG: hypothetical protein ACRDRH_18510 [Pseudonocardia sp.]
MVRALPASLTFNGPHGASEVAIKGIPSFMDLQEQRFALVNDG